MSMQGCPWSEIAGDRGQEIHRRIPEIKKWREEEFEAGRPSELEDFFRAHNLCFACKATGVKPDPVAWEGDIALYIKCEVCGGTGRWPRSDHP